MKPGENQGSSVFSYMWTVGRNMNEEIIFHTRRNKEDQSRDSWGEMRGNSEALRKEAIQILLTTYRNMSEWTYYL